MVYLTKEISLFKRDEKGELIPQEIELETLPDKPTIKVIPMSRGELLRIYSTAKEGVFSLDMDKEIITKYCKEPQFTINEVDDLKPVIAAAITTAILSVTLNLPQKQVMEKAESQLIAQGEDFLKKK